MKVIWYQSGREYGISSWGITRFKFHWVSTNDTYRQPSDIRGVDVGLTCNRGIKALDKALIVLYNEFKRCIWW